MFPVSSDTLANIGPLWRQRGELPVIIHTVHVRRKYAVVKNMLRVVKKMF